MILKEILVDLDKASKPLNLDILTNINKKLLAFPDLSEVCKATKNMDKYLSAQMLEL